MTTETAQAGTDTTQAGDATQTAAANPGTVLTQNTTPEVKGDADAKPATTDDGAKDDGKAGNDSPPVYDFKAPEGMELDTAAVDEFKAIAAELKLPADSAQKVVDLYAKLEQKRSEAFAAQVSEWGDQVKADKEIGGKNLEANIATAKAAVDKFATPEFKSMLDATGMGNHPEVVRMFVKIGKAISEDTMVRGTPGDAPKSAASVLYSSN